MHFLPGWSQGRCATPHSLCEAAQGYLYGPYWPNWNSVKLLYAGARKTCQPPLRQTGIVKITLASTKCGYKNLMIVCQNVQVCMIYLCVTLYLLFGMASSVLTRKA